MYLVNAIMKEAGHLHLLGACYYPATVLGTFQYSAVSHLVPPTHPLTTSSLAASTCTLAHVGSGLTSQHV